ncbi:transposase mutator family (plasmid) [Cupriavidus necator N-1]|uniref:Transposase mutator family n=1 Tax=Cupriavidus necator (strain ATCC 43291 / DSM 13513 / CCUG 52238 / LMG 8453 / N-1) TaxID=1042878 RepID=F8GXK5_CUPNN|nr:transposase mutator family [Cupriavidus necator N-1]
MAGFRLAWHTCSLSTCYALNTKFLTGPCVPSQKREQPSSSRPQFSGLELSLLAIYVP